MRNQLMKTSTEEVQPQRNEGDEEDHQGTGGN
jgi:hypothetical protein